MIDDEDERDDDGDGDGGDGHVAIDDGIVDDDDDVGGDDGNRVSSIIQGRHRGQHDVPWRLVQRLLLVRAGGRPSSCRCAAGAQLATRRSHNPLTHTGVPPRPFLL